MLVCSPAPACAAPQPTALSAFQVFAPEPAQLGQLDHRDPMARHVFQQPEPNVPVNRHQALPQEGRSLDLRQVVAGSDLRLVLAAAELAHEDDAGLGTGGVLLENPDEIGAGASHWRPLKVI